VPNGIILFKFVIYKCVDEALGLSVTGR
jgi:hypothetical protein